MGYANPQCAGSDQAVHGRGQQDRLAIDADRDLVGVRIDDHLVSGQGAQAAGVPALQQRSRGSGTVHGDGDDAEQAEVDPIPAAEASRVAQLVGVVADQDRRSVASMVSPPSMVTVSRGPA